jgi:YVTN family beta-propeller protein
MQTNTLAGVIPLYNTVAAMSYSSLTKKLFVACPDDTLSFSGNRGSVIVINTLTNTVYKKIKSGYEPYGIAVDDEQKFVAVANANLNNGGPSPHHVSKCGGRNGNVSFIDLNTLELIPGKKSEVAVFPYSVSTR